MVKQSKVIGQSRVSEALERHNRKQAEFGFHLLKVTRCRFEHKQLCSRFYTLKFLHMVLILVEQTMHCSGIQDPA